MRHFKKKNILILIIISKLKYSYKYNFQIKSINYGVSDGASVLVPDQGFLVFGGNSEKISQKLKSPESTWTNGPALFQDAAVTGHCAVQVRNLSTVFTNFLDWERDRDRDQV